MLAGIDVACFDVRPMRVRTLRLPFDITIALPGSKSVALRAIVAACLAEGRTTIVDATPCDDVLALADGLAKLGFRIRWFAQDDGILDIEGGLPEGDGSATALIDCGAGGAPLRFLSAVATLCPGTWTLTGNARLQQRPIAALCDALRQLGAQLDDTDGHAPLTIRGGGMLGGPVALDASTSSQHLSALLLIGSLLGSGIESGIESGLDIELTGPLVSAGYADLTARVLSDFGARIDVRGKRWSIAPRTLRSPGDLRIEGDWSAAGAFLVLARITRSRFRGANLALDSAQGDRLMPLLLEQLGDTGDLVVDLADTPDQAPNLVVAALFRDGETILGGGAHLRDKESDRITCLVTELQKTGADVVATADGFAVRGGRPLHGAALCSHGDHRLAMAFAVLGSVVEGIEIDDVDCVKKSYPRFFADLASCAQLPRAIALVGMRGAGKSTLAPALAEALSLQAADTDAEFERDHGPIRGFVQRHGWDAFRAHEAAIVARVIVPGQVVAIGGGAIESPGTERLLHDRALVVWLQEDVATLTERLARGDRPRLTELPLEEEVRTLLARREPAFAAVATTVLNGGSVAQRVTAVRDWLRAPWLAHPQTDTRKESDAGEQLR